MNPVTQESPFGRGTTLQSTSGTVTGQRKSRLFFMHTLQFSLIFPTTTGSVVLERRAGIAAIERESVSMPSAAGVHLAGASGREGTGPSAPGRTAAGLARRPFEHGRNRRCSQPRARPAESILASSFCALTIRTLSASIVKSRDTSFPFPPMYGIGACEPAHRSSDTWTSVNTTFSFCWPALTDRHLHGIGGQGPSATHSRRPVASMDPDWGSAIPDIHCL